jgi:hypothetical protein
MIITSLRTISVEATCLSHITSVMNQLQVLNPIGTILGDVIHAHLTPIRPTSCRRSEASIIEVTVLVCALYCSDAPKINEDVRNDARDRTTGTHKTIHIVV